MNAFLRELTELTKKYNMYLDNKYFDSTNLYDLSTHREIATAVGWDDRLMQYVADKAEK